MSNFAKDIKTGLSAPKKYMSSMYFYNDEGSQIFQEIMEMPEYYLTNAEMEIFQTQAKDIYKALCFDEPFNIIELGAGDGKKTSQLLKYLLSLNIDFEYLPIDISEKANKILVKNLKSEFPDLKIEAKTGDYFEILKEIKVSSKPTLLLFIGSNIGNYLTEQAENLLQLLNDNIKKGDKLLLGIDLKKNPLTVSNAYFDKAGITKKFNLNLLSRINQELGGNFDLNKFDFYSFYNPNNGEVKSYIVSLENQTVEIKQLDQSFQFNKGETIWTELSKKYSLNEIELIATKTKFKTIQHFLDSQNYFTDTLLEK